MKWITFYNTVLFILMNINTIRYINTITENCKVWSVNVFYYLILHYKRTDRKITFVNTQVNILSNKELN